MSRDGDRTFTYTLPPGTNLSHDGSFKVVVRSETAKAHEAYRARVFAVVRDCDKKTKKITLGEQDVFRPLASGEETTIIVDKIKPEAWVKEKQGHALKVGVEVIPAVTGREPPDVLLRVVGARFVSVPVDH